MEDLDRVAGWVLNQDLRATYTDQRLVAEVSAAGSEVRHDRLDVFHLQDNAVPAARFGDAAVQHGLVGRGVGA